MLKNIVFDLGAVLIDWNPRHFYRKVFADEKEMEYFLTQVYSPSQNIRSDAGEPFEQVAAELIRQFPEYEKQIALYYAHWAEMLGGEVIGSVQILRELKAKKVPVFALTNWSAQTFPTARKLFPFLAEFDGIVVSGEEKCIKPDPQIYKILLNRYHLQASETIFIDDNPANVAGAVALGMTGIHFTSPQALRTQLSSFL